ncbi:MAG TPA: hypothetical protein VD913_00420, partial [bacterium]|nr:hypothetical protein [bacterium]
NSLRIDGESNAFTVEVPGTGERTFSLKDGNLIRSEARALDQKAAEAVNLLREVEENLPYTEEIGDTFQEVLAQTEGLIRANELRHALQRVEDMLQFIRENAEVDETIDTIIDHEEREIFLTLARVHALLRNLLVLNPSPPATEMRGRKKALLAVFALVLGISVTSAILTFEKRNVGVPQAVRSQADIKQLIRAYTQTDKRYSDRVLRELLEIKEPSVVVNHLEDAFKEKALLVYQMQIQLIQGKAQDAQGIEELEKAIADGKNQMRRMVSLLILFKSSIWPWLEQNADSPETALRAGIIPYLAEAYETGTKEDKTRAAGILTRLANDPDRDVRLPAIMRLGGIPDKTVIAGLIAQLKSPEKMEDLSTVSAVSLSLLRIAENQSEAFDEILGVLGRKDYPVEVRATIITNLNVIPDSSKVFVKSVDEVIRNTADHDGFVRTAAVIVLGEQGLKTTDKALSEKIKAALETRMTDNNLVVRVTAKQAIDKLEKQTKRSEVRTDADDGSSVPRIIAEPHEPEFAMERLRQDLPPLTADGKEQLFSGFDQIRRILIAGVDENEASRLLKPLFQDTKRFFPNLIQKKIPVLVGTVENKKTDLKSFLLPNNRSLPDLVFIPQDYFGRFENEILADLEQTGFPTKKMILFESGREISVSELIFKISKASDTQRSELRQRTEPRREKVILGLLNKKLNYAYPSLKPLIGVAQAAEQTIDPKYAAYDRNLARKLIDLVIPTIEDDIRQTADLKDIKRELKRELDFLDALMSDSQLRDKLGLPEWSADGAGKVLLTTSGDWKNKLPVLLAALPLFAAFSGASGQLKKSPYRFAGPAENTRELKDKYLSAANGLTALERANVSRIFEFDVSAGFDDAISRELVRNRESAGIVALVQKGESLDALDVVPAAIENAADFAIGEASLVDQAASYFYRARLLHQLASDIQGRRLEAEKLGRKLSDRYWKNYVAVFFQRNLPDVVVSVNPDGSFNLSLSLISRQLGIFRQASEKLKSAA